jgi:hypothetical protein
LGFFLYLGLTCSTSMSAFALVLNNE